MAAAINLQRDAGVMLSNLQILSQNVVLNDGLGHWTVVVSEGRGRRLVALGIGQSLFPRAEVDDLSPAPRAARAASYMSAMGL